MKITSTNNYEINHDTDLFQLINEEERMTRELARIQTVLNKYGHSTKRLSYLKCWAEFTQLIEFIEPVVMGMHDQQIKTILDDTSRKKMLMKDSIPSMK